MGVGFGTGNMRILPGRGSIFRSRGTMAANADACSRPKRAKSRVDYNVLSTGGYDDGLDFDDLDTVPAQRRRHEPAEAGRPIHARPREDEGVRLPSHAEARALTAEPPAPPEPAASLPPLELEIEDGVDLDEASAAAFKVLCVLASPPSHLQHLVAATAAATTEALVASPEALRTATGAVPLAEIIKRVTENSYTSIGAFAWDMRALFAGIYRRHGDPSLSPLSRSALRLDETFERQLTLLPLRLRADVAVPVAAASATAAVSQQQQQQQQQPDAEAEDGARRSARRATPTVRVTTSTYELVRVEQEAEELARERRRREERAAEIERAEAWVANAGPADAVAELDHSSDVAAAVVFLRLLAHDLGLHVRPTLADIHLALLFPGVSHLFLRSHAALLQAVRRARTRKRKGSRSDVEAEACAPSLEEVDAAIEGTHSARKSAAPEGALSAAWATVAEVRARLCRAVGATVRIRRVAEERRLAGEESDDDDSESGEEVEEVGDVGRMAVSEGPVGRVAPGHQGERTGAVLSKLKRTVCVGAFDWLTQDVRAPTTPGLRALVHDAPFAPYAGSGAAASKSGSSAERTCGAEDRTASAIAPAADPVPIPGPAADDGAQDEHAVNHSPPNPVELGQECGTYSCLSAGERAHVLLLLCDQVLLEGSRGDEQLGDRIGELILTAPERPEAWLAAPITLSTYRPTPSPPCPLFFAIPRVAMCNGTAAAAVRECEGHLEPLGCDPATGSAYFQSPEDIESRVYIIPMREPYSRPTAEQWLLFAQAPALRLQGWPLGEAGANSQGATREQEAVNAGARAHSASDTRAGKNGKEAICTGLPAAGTHPRGAPQAVFRQPCGASAPSKKRTQQHSSLPIITSLCLGADEVREHCARLRRTVRGSPREVTESKRALAETLEERLELAEQRAPVVNRERRAARERVYAEAMAMMA